MKDETGFARPNSLRWLVCLMLWAATSINYMDRSVLSILAHTLHGELRWSEIDYANIVTAFTIAYGVGYAIAGRVIDRIGAKAGYVLFVLLWTLSAMAHAAVSSVLGFGLARFALGLAESGNFPAAIRVVTEWFPSDERALATGLFNSGSNSAALIAPFLIAAVLNRWGSWRYAFLSIGALGLVWLMFWIPFPYDRLRRERDAPLQAFRSVAPSQTTFSWTKLLRMRETWAFVVVKAMTDPVWWFYLFWLPKFLQDRFHLGISDLGRPLAAVYCVSSVGAVAGGWLSGFLIRRGTGPLQSRIWVLAGCSTLASTLILISHLHSVGATVAAFGILTAAHQAWAANLFAANSDVFPHSMLSAAVGVAGAAGAFGGVAFQKFTGYALERSHGDYTLMFWIAAFAYPTSLLVFWALLRRRRNGGGISA